MSYAGAGRPCSFFAGSTLAPGVEIMSDEGRYRGLCGQLMMWNPARYAFDEATDYCVNVLNPNMCSWDMWLAAWNYLVCELRPDRRVVVDGRGHEYCVWPGYDGKPSRASLYPFTRLWVTP